LLLYYNYNYFNKMLITNFFEFNYLEINILNKLHNLNNNHVIDINWDQDIFNKTLLKFINEKRYKPFEKNFKVLKHKDLTLNYNINENKYYVNKTSFIEHDINNNNITIKYNKENLPQISFPSTKNINDSYYVNKITFKITNRIYINFEIKKKIINDKEFIYRRIYINLNNEKNDKVDNDNTNNLLEKCINYF
jgi:hypothetical protein